jgi:hypothetical protein
VVRQSTAQHRNLVWPKPVLDQHQGSSWQLNLVTTIMGTLQQIHGNNHEEADGSVKSNSNRSRGVACAARGMGYEIPDWLT